MNINGDPMIDFPKDLTQRAIMDDANSKINYDVVNSVIQQFIDGLRKVKQENNIPPVDQINITIKGVDGASWGMEMNRSEANAIDKYLNTVSGWKVELHFEGKRLRTIQLPHVD